MKADNNGIFLVDIGVGREDGGDTQWIKAAVDTGSESLLVATDECKGCEEGKHLGTVKNQGELIKRGKIRYGSQQDTVVWRKKTIKIPAWLHTCDPEDHDGAHTDAVQCIVGDCPCALVEKRTGTSDYNILGLGSQSAHGPPATLNALFPDPPRAFQIEVLSLQEAKLIIHRPVGEDCRKPKYQFAVIDKAGGYGHHYLVRGSTPTMFRQAPMGAGNAGTVINNNTYNVLFDTGANAISLPPEIYDALDAAPHKKGTLSLDFTSLKQEKVTVRLDYNLLDKFNNQILRSPSSALLIVGITFLKNHILGFVDDGNSRIMTLDFTA